MKKIKIILSVAAILVTLSGCGNQKTQNNDNQTNNDTTTEATTDTSDNTTNSDSKNTDNNTETNKTASSSTHSKDTNVAVEKNNSSTNNNSSSQNNDKETSNDEKSFYGNWEIKKVAGYAKVSVGEKTSLIGLKISLSNNLATFGNESYNNPQYKMTNKTQNNMESEYKTILSKIGVSTDSIMQLNVSDKITLFIKDNNTLLYFDEGVFYEVKRE
ncbi:MULTISPECIES: lipoprotein [Clostridium]|uniref:Lipoprotein n=1 Tax=Clostridium beijerinckii TaxID=1520 RepID=A0A1S9MYR8_CLOBE|nr:MULTISPECIES: hypothetical protein [Clostridium]MBN7576892.1 hypothetical protein [Clostridium beijerinckii]MBN7582018.1 hypothetical protein [Clostridium beijerinckii]MBN7586672.1 hypothetical protein [Clostridium beijerinckii]MBO0522792.1 hypothetical protein [Clostridium beijerinckii]MZK49323.1 hypothetical protein [Clostridium beijerinckii]